MVVYFSNSSASYMLPLGQSVSMESPTNNNTRKKVCKACDRCRRKKSKCDGSNPCGKCKGYNETCVFSERKKSHDKVYPKGYVGVLEQQQAQLVAGLREQYRKLNAGEGWPGPALVEQQGGHPLTHSILERLDLLQPRDGSGPYEAFEGDFSRMEKRLQEEEQAAAGPIPKRRGSIGSDPSDHGHASSLSSNGIPCTSLKMQYDPYPASPQPTPPTMDQPLPHHQVPLSNKTMNTLPASYDRTTGMQTAAELMRSPFATEAPLMDDMLSGGLPTPFHGGYYDAHMDVSSAQPMMLNEWVTSINPRALQNDFAQFAWAAI